MSTCALVVPVYNENSVIGSTIDRLKKIIKSVPDVEFEIICVDDGSDDGSSSVLAGISDITVLTHGVNRGYGAALRSGLDYCSAEWVFIVDADGTYPLEDLPRFFDEIKPDSLIIIGNREGRGISTNPMKRLARWILRRMVHALTGVYVPDLNSGMRLFRLDLYREFRHLLPLKFSFTTTLTVASLYSGYHIKFIPIDYEVRIGQSSIRPVSDFISFSILIIRLASYFDPLRFFTPLAGAILIAAFGKGLRDILVNNYIGGLSITLAILGLQIFLTGAVCDTVNRRSQDSPTSGRKIRQYTVTRTSSETRE